LERVFGIICFDDAIQIKPNICFDDGESDQTQ